MTHHTIAFIGGGNMATSLIGGLVEKAYPASQIVVSTPSTETHNRLAQDFNVRTTRDNNAAASGASIVVLAVKPQMMKVVCTELAGALDHKPLIISVAAGITTEQMCRWTSAEHAVIRCIPNTPSLLHTGATAIFANRHCSPEQTALANEILGAVGIVETVDQEDLIDSATAVSGSGPAYYFLIMELMEKAGVELGLPPEVARNLTIQTALGAAKMAAQGEVEPSELRRRVTSHKGTTDRAITTFLNEGLEDIIRHGMTGARDRGREMAEEMNQ